MQSSRVINAIAAHLRRRAEWYVVPLFFLGLVGWRYREIWHGKVGIGWDVIESYWSDLTFFANELRRWHFPLWNPYGRGGYPAHADPQPALFSPLQWLMALWASRDRAASWYVIQVKELLHQALAGVLLHVYLRSRKQPWPAALLGGVTLVLSGPWLINSSNNYLYAIAWAPLVWLAIDRLLEAPDLRGGAVLAGALYLPASEGSPPGYFYLLLTAVGYGVFRAVPWLVPRLRRLLGRAARDQLAGRPAGPELGRVAKGIVIALALTAATQLILILPARELLSASWRQALPPSHALEQSCPLVPALTSIVTPNTTAFGMNLSLVAVALALYGIFAAPTRDRGASLFFLAGAAFFLALSLGAKTPILGWLVRHLPGFSLFRVSCRYAVPYALLLAPAAAFGLTSLIDMAARPTLRAHAALVAVAAALSGAIGLVSRTVPAAALKPPFASGWWLMAAGTIGALALLLRVPRRWAGPLSLGLLGLAYFDTTRFYARDPARQPRPDDREDLAKVAHLQELDRYRIFDDFVLEQRSGPRLALREFRGYLISDPLASREHAAILAAAVLTPELLGEYNVRYVLYGPHSIKGWGRKLISAAPDALAPGRFRRLDGKTFEVVHPAPMVAWYGQVRALPAADVLPALLHARDAAGTRTLAFVSKGDLGPAQAEPRLMDLMARDANPPAPSVAGRVVRYDTELVDVDVEAPATGVVVLNEAYAPGWRVFVDGQERAPLKVDLLLRGVLVDGGHHRIRWVYEPRRFRLLLALWAVGLLAILLGLRRTGLLDRSNMTFAETW